MKKKHPSRLLQDGDGHWYMIPVGIEEVFEAWCSVMEDGSDWFGDDFNELRVDNPHRLQIFDWREE